MSDPAIDHLRAAIRLLRQTPDRIPSAVAAEVALALAQPGDFGQHLKSRREAANLSVQALADRTGLSINTLRNLEAGRTDPAPDSMERLILVPELHLGGATHAPPETPRDLRPNSYLPPRYDPSAMAQALRAVVNGPGGTLEQSFLYLDNQSAADYLKVCEAYGSTRGRLFGELHAIADLVGEMGPTFDVVAIGSGDGRAEVCLTQALAHLGKAGRLYLLDISHTLLTHAHEHAAVVLQPHGVNVKAVHGNFHDLQCYQMLHARPGRGPRIYTLLGATIANLTDEMRFFRDLQSCAAPGDLLLLDYQVAHDPPEGDPTLQSGAVPKIFLDWGTGPLLRNNPQVRSVSLTPLLAPGHIPGSYIIFQVASAGMADGTTRTYRVMNSARYTPAALSEALSGAGWETVRASAYDKRTAVMLLRRI